MREPSPLEIETGPEAVKLPRRIALVHRSVPARFVTREEREVMTFPHLVVREAIALEILLIALGLLALFYDAPLESLANPNKTPNPAKAPWYFLGLQELLHYFPPVVAGVLIPLLAVLALVVIPYFRVNMERKALWSDREVSGLTALLAVGTAFSALLAAFRCYVELAPTLAYVFAMAALYLPPDRSPWRLAPFLIRLHTRLAPHSLAVWLMSWFLTTVVVLTATGTFFRGPGWSFVWPWQG